MSSVRFKTTSTEEKMNMYESMVEELVGGGGGVGGGGASDDESSQFILDGKLRKRLLEN
jgi:hypothetical protein